MSISTTAGALWLAVEARSETAACGWLQAIGNVEALTNGVFFGAYAGVSRRFASASKTPLSRDRCDALERVGVIAPPAWSVADLARGYLLITMFDRGAAHEPTALVREVFRKGDNHERVALLRSLSLLPQSERFLETAIEACRTHVQDVFEAIACENPYPAAYFPALNFQQLVMKALFTGAPLDRIHGWRERVTDDLKRMAADFAAERSAAGREVPTDVGMILHGVTR